MSTLPGEENRAAGALAAHRYLMRLSSALVNGFLWVFIFLYFTITRTLPQALEEVALLYALTQTITILLVPFAARRLPGGMRRGMIYGTITAAAAFTFLGTFFDGAFSNGIVMIAVLLGAYAAFYRVPYAVERAALSHNRPSPLFPEIVLALCACMGGIFLDSGGLASRLVFLAAILNVIALLPLFLVPNVYENFSWGYRETFHSLMAPENRQLLTASLWKGIQAAVLFFFWPIVLYVFFQGSFLELGAAFSATLLVILLFRASGRRVMISQHADGGAYLDEHTALKEMSLAFGRLAFCLLIVLVAVFV